MNNTIVLSGMPIRQSKAAITIKSAYDSGLIEVDLDHSQVFSIDIRTKQYKLLPIFINNRGYAIISIYHPMFKDSVRLLLHRVLAYSMWGDAALVNGIDIDHIDGNTRNNKVSNLQMLTHADNILKGKFAKSHPNKLYEYHNEVAS